MRALRLVTAAGLAGALLAFGAGAALDGCVLPTFETGELEGDAGAGTGGEGGGSRHDAGDAGAADGAVEAGPGPCVSVGPPFPPSGADDGQTVGDIWLALHTIAFGDDGSTPGFDLDRVCTCYEDAGPTCVGSSQACDAPGGVDNALAKLFAQIKAAIPAFSSLSFSEGADMGKWTLLLKITGYNGLADDPSVGIALYVSPGGVSPKWDGTDVWPVAASSVSPDGGIASPLYQTDGAYVAGHVLYGGVKSLSIRAAGGNGSNFQVSLGGGGIMGTLEPDSASYRLTNGTIAGRVSTQDLFLALSSYRDDMGTPFCVPAPPLGSVAIQNICAARDIRSSAGDPLSLPCDALSLGLGFVADPVAPSVAVSPVVAPTKTCPPDQDFANSTCP